MPDKIEIIQNIDLQDVWQGKKSGVEENVKLKIILPLLEALGYEPVKDMDFEHFVENKRADIAILIDKKPKIVVECKSLEKNLDDYISQALNYAIKKAIPYILLTNGKEFRLYKPFIENLINPKDRLLVSANLNTLVEDYEELKEWVSKESLTKKRIERKTEKVVEKLRDEITPKTLIENLTNAKRILVDDAKQKILPKFSSDLVFRKLIDEWVKDSELDIKKTEKWVDILANEIAYSFINKLYFFRIAEDRGIVKPKLNKQSIGQIIRYLEYNQLIKMSFDEILKIDYEAIFKHDIFDKIEFDERNLKKITDQLAEYNFAQINSDIIGKIYEYHVSREERKRLGQFYTPEPIIDFVLKSIPIKGTDRLLDPACGSGGFLIRAYDKFLNQLSGNKNIKNVHKHIIENNLFGYDINPFSVHLTAMNLALKNIENKTDVINILEKDSLAGNLDYFLNTHKIKTLDSKVREVDTARYKHAFDVIVGNPPYFNMTQQQIKEKYAGQGFEEISTGVTNIASLFLKKYISLLEPKGYLGFIVPKSLTYSDSWEGIRKFILEKAGIVKIFDIHEAFEGVLLEQIAIILQKKPCNKTEYVEVQYVDLPYTKNKTGKHKVNAGLFNAKMFPIYQYPENERIFKRINKDSKKLSEISEPIFRGLPIQKYEYLFTDKRTTEDDLPLLRGVNIGRFAFKDKIQYVSWKRPEFNAYANQVKRLLKPKIIGQRLIAQTGNHMKLIATMDEKGDYLEVDTANNIILTDGSFGLKYILGIINSKLASYYIYNFVFNRAVRTMDFRYVSELPIKAVGKIGSKKLIEIVEKILDSRDGFNEDLEKELNKEVYAIYGLNPNQIKIIENSFD